MGGSADACIQVAASIFKWGGKSQCSRTRHELEKRLTDLAFLKETVRKLKEDLAVARRLDWIRRGIYDVIAVKGGERLTHPLALGTPAPAPALEVEIQQNGAVSVTPRPAPESPEDPAPQ
jgi:hypothetical protein